MKVLEVNSKKLCISTLRQVEGIQTGFAFHQQDIRATCLSLGQITGVDYCSGYIVASKIYYNIHYLLSV